MKIWTSILAILALLILGRSQSNAVEAPAALPTVTVPAVPGPTVTLRHGQVPIVRPRVTAAVESEPVPHAGDAADDPAIWVHPTEPGQSTIIVTDKLGGLAVYDLAGKQLQYLPDGRLNNVDLRDHFPLGGKLVTLVTASNRSDNTIAVYRVDPATRLLERVAARTLVTYPAYGACMYRSAVTSTYYYIVTSHDGTAEQWRLFDNGQGKVDAAKVRTLKLATQTEGCVADDQLGRLYIAEEDTGIWKFGADPDSGTDHTLIAPTGRAGHLTAEVEGLAIAYGSGDTGYLMASSQGNSTFAVYHRDGDNAYIGSFSIVDGFGIDGVSDTDGIDVTTANLGDAFPQGVFVAQDGTNGSRNQNVKLVPLQAIIGKRAIQSR